MKKVTSDEKTCQDSLDAGSLSLEVLGLRLAEQVMTVIFMFSLLIFLGVSTFRQLPMAGYWSFAILCLIRYGLYSQVLRHATRVRVVRPSSAETKMDTTYRPYDALVTVLSNPELRSELPPTPARIRTNNWMGPLNPIWAGLYFFWILMASPAMILYAWVKWPAFWAVPILIFFSLTLSTLPMLVWRYFRAIRYRLTPSGDAIIGWFSKCARPLSSTQCVTPSMDEWLGVTYYKLDFAEYSLYLYDRYDDPLTIPACLNLYASGVPIAKAG